MEHRWGERVAIRVPVELSGGTHTGILGSLENVSSSGAFIRLLGAVPPRGPVQVRLASAQSSRGRAVRIAAYIVRVTAGGVGIEWRQFAPPSVRELLRAGARQPLQTVTGRRREPKRATLAHAALTAAGAERRSSDSRAASNEPAT